MTQQISALEAIRDIVDSSGNPQEIKRFELGIELYRVFLDEIKGYLIATPKGTVPVCTLNLNGLSFEIKPQSNIEDYELRIVPMEDVSGTFTIEESGIKSE